MGVLHEVRALFWDSQPRTYSFKDLSEPHERKVHLGQLSYRQATETENTSGLARDTATDPSKVFGPSGLYPRANGLVESCTVVAKSPDTPRWIIDFTAWMPIMVSDGRSVPAGKP